MDVRGLDGRHKGPGIAVTVRPGQVVANARDFRQARPREPVHEERSVPPPGGGNCDLTPDFARVRHARYGWGSPRCAPGVASVRGLAEDLVLGRSHSAIEAPAGVNVADVCVSRLVGGRERAIAGLRVVVDGDGVLVIKEEGTEGALDVVVDPPAVAQRPGPP